MSPPRPRLDSGSDPERQSGSDAGSGPESESRFSSLVAAVPGMRPETPRRNLLLALSAALIASLAVGQLAAI